MTDPAPDEHWTRVQGLFHGAFDLAPEEIPAFLAEECGDNDQLKAEVTGLLDARESSETFFDSLGSQLFASESGSGGRATRALYEACDPVVGSTIRNYEIVRVLGEGGMGQVYEGHDTTLKRGVALKFLPVGEPDSEPYQRFMLEARATAALDHENVCAIHEIGETEDGRPFLVMALYEGETVQTELGRGAIPREIALSYALQSCGGLEAAHDAGIIHRDVKPGNLFVTNTGTLKVLDFGLAKLSDVTLTDGRRTMGTLTYMSPEQMSGERVDPRTDVWSLGVVLYEMLTGVNPFSAKNAAEAISAIVERDPARPRTLDDSISQGLEQVVLSALQKDRERRTASIYELRAQLLQCK